MELKVFGGQAKPRVPISAKLVANIITIDKLRTLFCLAIFDGTWLE